jgi:putative ABC transport system permease protein
LKSGVTLEQARAEMDTIGARIAQDFPDSNKGWGIAITRLADVIVGRDMRQSLYVLLGAVGMVLLIGCANLANLLLARAMARDREVAIRAALGAGRGRLVRQFLTESILLSFAGGGLGLGVGYATMQGLKIALPAYSLPSEAHVVLDARVLGFALLLTAFTGILCGLVPALQATHPNLTTGMKQAGGGASAGRARVSMRATLVVIEVALAFVLLTSAGLLLRSFARLQVVEVGFAGERVLTAHLPVPRDRVPNPEAMHAYLQSIEDAVAALPGVQHVAFTSALPLRGWGYGMPFQLADQPTVDRAHRPGGFFKMVSPAYFETVGLRLLSGRRLTAQDTRGAPPVTVISDAMRRKHFADVDPIGQRILIQEIAFGKTELGPEIAWEVVGVVADEKVGGLQEMDGTPGVYVSVAQSPAMFLSLAVLTASDAAMLHRPLREAVRRVDPDQALPEMKTLEQIKTESLGSTRLRTVLLSVFAGVALLLATTGLYGVISYSVAQRTRELGIRSALGASAGDILRLVLRHGMTMVAIGLLVGGAGVFAVTRLLSTMLFGVGTRDPATIAVVAVGLAGVALTACLVPARRATKVDPIIALRAE